MPQILKPEIFEEKDLCLYDKKELLEDAELIFKQDDIKVYWKTCKHFSLIDEDYIFIIYKRTLVSVTEFWFHELKRKQVPKIKNTTTLKKFRGKGFGFLIYTCLIKKFGCLLSDVTLNGNKDIPNGSYGLWLKLMKLYKHSIFDEKSKRFMKYTEYSAFKSTFNSYRRLYITIK